ncbi:hypothetical protein RHMOL_Rhmol11G0178500 [Rhododendron molle]|uniref:Uncharacterized protein n=1 Tax=Rhododendron molle TaxID=49168 RepID=A0ACC0LUH2_RHOML|nr:hypothetical protein RHMOL_Rhmol11G0178500 [Rhododendron molle]
MSSQRCFRLLNAVDKSLYRDNILYVMVVGVALPAVFKQFGAGGYGSDNVVPDKAELQHHQKLEKLYISTRAAKHFQKDIVRGVEGYIVTGSKQVEIEPLRAMVMGAPLEDARHLAQRYDRVRQEAESPAIEVSRRQAKFRETGNPDVALKLEASETKQQDLKSNMGILVYMCMELDLETDLCWILPRLFSRLNQNELIIREFFRYLISLKARTYLFLLENLREVPIVVIRQMISERQRIEAPLSPIMDSMPLPPSYEEVNGVFASPTTNGSTDSMGYFLGEVMYSYQAESDVELNLSIVLQLFMFHGFDRGQTMAGPNANARGKPVGFHLGTYVERRERVLASKVAALR